MSCFLCFTAALSVAQTNFDWAISFGGANLDYGSSIVADSSGNSYATGSFGGTVDFDPGVGTTFVSSAGFSDFFIQKLDSTGNLLWVKTFGGSQNDEGFSITIDIIGDIYVTGHFVGTIDFDPGAGVNNLTSNGNIDAFILKMDANGNFIWAKSFGGTSADQGQEITTDIDGNVYVTGKFWFTVDFDPNAGIYNLTSSGNGDIFILKLSSTGNFVMAKAINGSADNYSYGIDLDTNNSIYITGTFKDTLDFDPGPGINELISLGNTDAYFLKLDSNGIFQWVNIVGSSGFEVGESVQVDFAGNIYVTTNVAFNVILQKFDANGILIWDRTIGTSGTNDAFSSHLDDWGNIYLTGMFTNTSDFDPGPGITNLISSGSNDIFVIKINGNGDLVWANSMGGSVDDRGWSIFINNSKHVYITGYFNGTSDLDPSAGVSNHTSNGSWDIYTLRLSQQCTVFSSTLNVVTCDEYYSPGGNHWTTSGNYTDVLYGASSTGCDSLIYTNLTINTVDTSVTNTDPILTANASGVIYQWIDCGTMLAISGETNQNYTATTNGSYAVVVTGNGCTDTSSCNAVLSIGLIENNFHSELDIYPSPTDGKFSVDLGANYASVHVIITNINGKLLQQSKHAQSQILKLNIDQPAGIYFLTIRSENQKAIIKIVKK